MHSKRGGAPKAHFCSMGGWEYRWTKYAHTILEHFLTPITNRGNSIVENAQTNAKFVKNA